MICVKYMWVVVYAVLTAGSIRKRSTTVYLIRHIGDAEQGKPDEKANPEDNVPGELITLDSWQSPYGDHRNLG